MIFNTAVRIVFERMPQPAHRAVDKDFLLWVRTAPPRSITPKQTDVGIRVPASAPPPALQITNQARHRVAAFFFTDTPPTEIYTLSLHDALPISTVLLRCPSMHALWMQVVQHSAAHS